MMAEGNSNGALDISDVTTTVETIDINKATDQSQPENLKETLKAEDAETTEDKKTVENVSNDATLSDSTAQDKHVTPNNDIAENDPENDTPSTATPENGSSGETVSQGDRMAQPDVILGERQGPDGSELKDVKQELGATGGTDPLDKSSEACSSGEGSNGSNEPVQSVYHVKWIKFKGEKTAIITQNENGPCPLLAILNVLLLKGKLKLPAMLDIVSSGQLMEYLGDCIFENAPNLSEDNRLNYEQNMSDAMTVFHKLQTGLDVNVKFTGVSDFEYTRECIVFDLLNIQLYHGWLVDPQDQVQVKAVGNCSYNQLVEKIITQKNSSEESQITEALVGEEFLSKTCHQLTYHGLSSLNSHLKEGELVVFFRNNHFSTLLKHKDELLLLVTDQGFLSEGNVVWETLSNVEGDGHFLDAEFRTFSKAVSQPLPTPPHVSPGSEQQVDQDYLVALSLQQDTAGETGGFEGSETAGPTLLPQGGAALTDHELALKLQEEEDRQLALMHQQQQQQQQEQDPSRGEQQARRQQQAQRNQQRLQEAYEEQQAESRKKKSDCTIL